MKSGVLMLSFLMLFASSAFAGLAVNGVSGAILNPKLPVLPKSPENTPMDIKLCKDKQGKDCYYVKTTDQCPKPLPAGVVSCQYVNSGAGPIR